MSTTRTLMTADELLVMPDEGFRYELVNGELKPMPPAGSEHEIISAKFIIRLGPFVEANNLGVVFTGNAGFKIASDPDTVRVPDVAFVHRDHIPEGGVPRGLWQGAPDLVVEVISPGDTYTEVEDKVKQWLDAGVRLVIVANPRIRVLTLHRSPTDVTRLTESDTLAFEDVVPGFSCPVSTLFI